MHLSSNPTRPPILPLCALLAAACNVTDPPENTGGTDVQAGLCGRGLVVVHTDYQSTNVSLLGVDGEVLSSSFISSGSSATGLSSPLGGDVILPTQSQRGDEIVLLDRYPASVLTWIDVRTGEPTGQMSLATGFSANPHDLIVLSSDKAYVSRYEPNLQHGREPFDRGDDVLVIDPTTLAVVDRIDLAGAMTDAPPGIFARPDKLIQLEDRVLLLLGAYSLDYLTSDSSRVAVLDPDTDTVGDVLILDGMHGCTGMAVSPSGHDVAIACSGEFGGDSISSMAESGIVLLSTQGGIVERRRFPAAKFGQGPVAGSIAYASDTRLVFTTFGQFEEGGQPERQDALVQLDSDRGDFEVLLHSDGEPFSFGDVACAPNCQACFVADAVRHGGVVHRYAVDDRGDLIDREELVVDREIGLPPRDLGWF